MANYYPYSNGSWSISTTPNIQYPSYNPAYVSPNGINPQHIINGRSSGIIWVQGIAGANAFNDIAPGDSVPLFDSENPVIYIKSVDMNGRPKELEIYDLVKRQSTTAPVAPPIDTTKFVARDELDSFVENKVKEIMKRNKNGKKGDAK